MEDEELLNESQKITQSLKEKTFEYLKQCNVELPIPVKNAIDDVFDENDFTSDEEGVLNFYFNDTLECFLHDVTPFTQLNVQVNGGNSSGDIIKKYSYYNTVDVRESYYEDIGLYDGEQLISSFNKKEITGPTKLDDPNDFAVFVLEEQEFHYGEYTVVPRVYIYIPKDAPADC